MIYSAEDILIRLTENNPISIIRFGDGEAITLKGFKDYSKYHAVLKRQLGFSPPIEHAEQIRENLIQAYKGADIIGIPMHKQIDRLDESWRMAEQILNYTVPEHTKDHCSIDIGYDFLDAGYFDILLKDREVLNYISCRDLDDKFKEKYGIKTVNIYQISPEAKFTSGYQGDVHYPTQFNKVQRWMDVMADKHFGSLLLVGGGIIGKIYCNWWRDRGGVAFDIGSVFDEWAGLITRGPERGLDKQGSKYKL